MVPKVFTIVFCRAMVRPYCLFAPQKTYIVHIRTRTPHHCTRAYVSIIFGALLKYSTREHYAHPRWAGGFPNTKHQPTNTATPPTLNVRAANNDRATDTHRIKSNVPRRRGAMPWWRCIWSVESGRHGIIKCAACSVQCDVCRTRVRVGCVRVCVACSPGLLHYIFQRTIYE